jgi:hypothetical protein
MGLCTGSFTGRPLAWVSTKFTNNQVMTGLLRFAHVILRGVMAFPLEPRLEYGLHGLDQTTIDLPKCSIRFVRRQEGPPNITHVVCLVVSPWRVPLRVSRAVCFVWHYDTTFVEKLFQRRLPTDLNISHWKHVEPTSICLSQTCLPRIEQPCWRVRRLESKNGLIADSFSVPRGRIFYLLETDSVALRTVQKDKIPH